MKAMPLLLAAVLTVGCSREVPDSPEAANETQEAAEVASNAGNVLEEEPLPPVPINTAAGEAGRDEWTWTHFRSGGADGFPVLVYGARGSDEMVINLQCRERGKITLLQMRGGVGEGRDGPIVLTSGGQRTAFDVTLGPDSGDGHTPAAAPAAFDHPLLAAFRKTGRLAVTSDGRSRAVDAIDDIEKATIARFFESCAGEAP